LLIHKVRVDGQMFILQPGQDVKELQADILRAAERGAGFVDFQTIGRSNISVLITPNVGVRFESLERTDEQIAEWEHDPPSIDTTMDYDDLV
jgi:hypothetical protein